MKNGNERWKSSSILKQNFGQVERIMLNFDMILIFWFVIVKEIIKAVNVFIN